MAMENPLFEDVFPIQNWWIFQCHVRFQGCKIPIGSMYWYIYLLIYHKVQPFMYLNIPFVPWIRHGKKNIFFGSVVKVCFSIHATTRRGGFRGNHRFPEMSVDPRPLLATSSEARHFGEVEEYVSGQFITTFSAGKGHPKWWWKVRVPSPPKWP